MRMIPFHREHLNLIQPKDADIERYGKIDADMENPVIEYGVNFTLIEDGRILGCGGILPTTHGVGSCYTLISRYAHMYGMKVFRITKKQLENIMKDFNLHRVETANLADAEDHHRWCKLLGFVDEGALMKYDNKKRDYRRFAKLMEV